MNLHLINLSKFNCIYSLVLKIDLDAHGLSSDSQNPDQILTLSNTSLIINYAVFADSNKTILQETNAVLSQRNFKSQRFISHI